jgi:hypothetical protein
LLCKPRAAPEFDIKAPEQDERRCEFDQAVDPECGEGQTSGSEAGTDRDGELSPNFGDGGAGQAAAVMG